MHCLDMLDEAGVNDTFSVNNVYLNLKHARGDRTKMYPLELGRAQGLLHGFCKVRYVNTLNFSVLMKYFP